MMTRYLLLIGALTSVACSTGAPTTAETPAGAAPQPSTASSPTEPDSSEPQTLRADADEAWPSKPSEPAERFAATFGQQATKACTRLGGGRTHKGLDPAYAEALLIADRAGVLTDSEQREPSGSWADLEEEMRAKAAEVAAENGGDTEQVDLLVPMSIIGEGGGREANAVARVPDRRGLMVALENAADDFLVAVRTCAPPKKARVTPRRLSEVTKGAEKAAAWATKQEGMPFTAVGEIKGNFGAGVDRVVVVAPTKRTELTESIENDDAAYAAFSCEAEFAIAMRGDRVHGDLAVARPIGAAAQRACAENPNLLLDALGLAGVSDLDGNGVEELLWTYNFFPSPRTQALVLTALSGRDFRRWDLASHTYAGSEVFIDPKQCGRAATKWGLMGDGPRCAMEG